MKKVKPIRLIPIQEKLKKQFYHILVPAGVGKSSGVPERLERMFKHYKLIDKKIKE